jgi:hypothetical protein
MPRGVHQCTASNRQLTIEPIIKANASKRPAASSGVILRATPIIESVQQNGDTAMITDDALLTDRERELSEWARSILPAEDDHTPALLIDDPAMQRIFASLDASSVKAGHSFKDAVVACCLAGVSMAVALVSLFLALA